MRLVECLCATIAVVALMSMPAMAASRRDWNDCEANDPDRSIAGCTRLLQGRSETAHNRAVAYSNRGAAYNDKGDYDRAIADFNEAIRLDPTYTNAYNNRGKAYNRKGDYDRAIADFNEAIRLDPTYTYAYNGRGNAHDEKGDHDRAIADFNEAIRLNPTYVYAYYNRGAAYFRKGDYDRAIVDLNEVIRLDPKYADGYNRRALAYYKKGDLDHAVQDQKTSIALQAPKNDRPWIDLAAYQRGLKEYEAALASLRNAAKLDEDAGKEPEMDFYYHMGWTLQLMGRHGDAIEAFNKGIPKQPDYYWARFRRGLSYEQIGEREKAIQDFKDAAAHIDRKYWNDELRNKVAEYGLQSLGTGETNSGNLSPAPVPTPPVTSGFCPSSETAPEGFALVNDAKQSRLEVLQSGADVQTKLFIKDKMSTGLLYRGLFSLFSTYPSGVGGSNSTTYDDFDYRNDFKLEVGYHRTFHITTRNANGTRKETVELEVTGRQNVAVGNCQYNTFVIETVSEPADSTAKMILRRFYSPELMISLHSTSRFEDITAESSWDRIEPLGGRSAATGSGAEQH